MKRASVGWSAMAASFVLSLPSGELIYDNGTFTLKSEAGKITRAEGDVRLRPADRMVWFSTSQDKVLWSHDAVSSGLKSSATVEASSGERVVMRSNSLLLFDHAGDNHRVDLITGLFRVSLDGKVEIGLKGHPVVVNAKNAELEIVMAPPKQPKVTLVKGEARIKVESEPQILLELAKPVRLTHSRGGGPQVSESAKAATRKVAQVVNKLIPEPVEQPYNLKLYDMFESTGTGLRPREKLPDVVKTRLRLTWAPPEVHKPARIQVSTRKDMDQPLEVTSDQGFLDFDSAHVGPNYWRVSEEEGKWSWPETVVIKPVQTPQGKPLVRVGRDPVPVIDGEETSIEIPVVSAIKPIGYVVQSSADKAFGAPFTQTFWTRESPVRASFLKPGVYYYRFAAVNEQQEVSAWSDPAVLTVVKKKAPPRLAHVRKKAPPRAPAAVNESAVAMKEEPEPTIRWKNSEWGLTGSYWSTNAAGSDSSNQAAAMGLGLHYLKWFGANNDRGLEANLKKSVQGAGDKALRAEILYHRRYSKHWPFGDSKREMQVSIFGGYAMKRDSAGVFADHYDLLKLGSMIRVPGEGRWVYGADASLAFISKGDNDIEFSVQADRAWTPDWSWGFGLRYDTFEAKSTTTSPGGTLPYRESFFETFSTLTYHFK